MNFSQKELDEREVERAERDAARGVIDLSKLTTAQREQYRKAKKQERRNYAFKNGLNMYNFMCNTGRVQISYPPYREQRVKNGNKEIVIRHFN